MVLKISRTISGVTPVAVMTRPMGCPGRCVYCPSDPSAPRSYTPESPAVLRGARLDFDARRQVEARLRMLRVMGHPTDKVEIIVMGGTFLAAPVDYQYQFVKACYDGLNGAESSGLEEAKKMNQVAQHRCVGLCIETRPDRCGLDEIARMLDFGATRVEIGVQALDDSIYELVNRGHTVEDVVAATRRLREAGFKVHYHWMPGLPGSDLEHDLEMSRTLFSNPDFRPDGLKLYPTLVVKGTELEEWYRAGQYHPYRMDDLVRLLAEIKALLPEYVRVSRVMRDIPTRFIVAGCTDLALRDSLRKRMPELGVRCRCIRCREYGHRARDGWRTGEPRLSRLDYQSSAGAEVFLSYVDDSDTLFGLLRLTVPARVHRSEGGGAALVRELHVFGPEVELSRRSGPAAQHKGIGRSLLKEAERIALDEFARGRLLVLSGVGAREYYSEHGYLPEGPYMSKQLGPAGREPDRRGA